MWMLVSYYLPGNSSAHPLAGGPTGREEDEQSNLTSPSRPVGGRMSKVSFSGTAVRLHVYLVFVKSIEQELKIQ